MENSTWEIFSRPNRANIITNKLCFKMKKDRFEHILKYKTRWVTHRYKQEEDLDYVKNFMIIVKLMIY